VNYILLDDEDFCHYLQNSTENFGAIKKYIQNKKEKQKNITVGDAIIWFLIF